MADATEPLILTPALIRPTEPINPAPASSSPARLRLLARIHRRYQTVAEVLELGALHLNFTRIADPDRVLDEVAEAVDRRERQTGQRQKEPQHLPYWAELWDSAVGMGVFLATSCGEIVGKWGGLDATTWNHPTTSALVISTPPRRQPQRVLDLGCGMGLAGTVAAALGAEVVFADLEPPALLFARLNSMDHSRRVRTRRLNWQTDRLSHRFDVMLGADILYERAQWEYLDPFWRAHLEPGGCILLGEPGRQTGDLFIDWVRERGWNLHQFDVPVATRPRPVRIFRLTH